MDHQADPNSPQASTSPLAGPLVVKLVGAGNTGLRVIDLLLAEGFSAADCAVVNTDVQSITASAAAQKFHLESSLLRGLGSGGDPDRGRALAEERSGEIKAWCEGAAVVMIVAGLGGGAGTGSAPVVARIARETGAMALGFVLTPFECEGNRRQQLAEIGLTELREAADAVICLRNQSVFKLIDESTSVLETFRLTNSLLADAVRGVWRLLRHHGLLDIAFAQICDLFQDVHTESAFAVAEAVGPTRSRDVFDKLLAHPLLDGGRVLAESDSVLVSLLGGPDLTMAEVSRLMTQFNQHCAHSQVMLGAAIDQSFGDRLAVTVIAARPGVPPAAPRGLVTGTAEGLDTQLLRSAAPARTGSRFVPPPPALPSERVAELLARQRQTPGRGRKAAPKLRQTQLPLEIVSKGRFNKSEPTIHKGEDLDVPTYLRRGVALN